MVSKDCTHVLGPGVPGSPAVCFCITNDSLAERSKAVAQGAIPKGCGFEPHSCQSCMQYVCVPQTIAVPRLKIVHFRCSACAQPGRAHTTDFCGPSCHAVTPRHRAVVSKDCTLVLGPVVPGIAAACFCITKDSLAERSKVVAQGAIPKGRGFEPHSCQSCMQWL